MICGHKPCPNEVPEGHERYCSPLCRKRAKRKRPPSAKRMSPAAKAKARKHPFPRFKAATKPGKRLKVPESARAQDQARELVEERGLCAYENRKGLIRDIGEAKKPENASRIFSYRGERPAAQGASGHT